MSDNTKDLFTSNISDDAWNGMEPIPSVNASVSADPEADTA